MNSPLPEVSLNNEISCHCRTGQDIFCTNDENRLTMGPPGSVETAQACAVQIPMPLDSVKVRRRVEDYLRKYASDRDILRVASCLGVSLR